MEYICHICKNKFNKRNGKHIYFCASKYNLLKTNDQIKFDQILFAHKEGFPNGITFEIINDLYTIQEWSLPDFLELKGLPYITTLFLLDFFKIPKRKTASNRCKEKYKNTNLQRFGVENPSSSPEIKQRRINTNLERFGVDNIRKSEWFRKYYTELMQERYGCGSLPNRYGNKNKWWEKQSKEYKKETGQRLKSSYQKWYSTLSEEEINSINFKKCRPLVAISSSSLEDKLADILLYLNIPFIRQKWIKNKSFDFHILNTNIIIEVNGDYWHANPKLYKADDIIKYPQNKIVTAKEKWAEDEKKRLTAETYGYTVLYIWETEFRLLNDLELSNLILEGISHVVQDKINQKD